MEKRGHSLNPVRPFTEHTQLWWSASPGGCYTLILLWDSRSKGTHSDRGLSWGPTHGWGPGHRGGQSLSSPLEILHTLPHCSGPLSLTNWLTKGTFSSNLALPLGRLAPEVCAACTYSWSTFKLLSLRTTSLINFGGSLCYLIPRELNSSIIPILEMRRLWFRSPLSPAKDHTPREWKSWHWSPALRTSKAVFFPPGYPALNTVIICYLQTLSIIELNKKLGITAERKSLIIHSSPCISFPCSLPIFLPLYGLSDMPSFYLRTPAKPQFPVFCLVIQGRK